MKVASSPLTLPRKCRHTAPLSLGLPTKPSFSTRLRRQQMLWSRMERPSSSEGLSERIPINQGLVFHGCPKSLSLATYLVIPLIMNDDRRSSSSSHPASLRPPVKHKM